MIDKEDSSSGTPFNKRYSEAQDNYRSGFSGFLVKNGQFASYEIEADCVASDYAPLPIRQAPERSEWPYSLFRKMRNIQDNGYSYNMGDASQFYDQATFMADFEDGFDETVPYHSTLPRYSNMNDSQLRCYFTWRTNVRKGEIKETPLPYIYVHIFELINSIGVIDKLDGIAKMASLLNGCSRFTDHFNRCLPEWIKDYYVCSEFAVPFQQLAAILGIQKFYPGNFADTFTGTDLFWTYSRYSDYDSGQSRFITEANRQQAEECFGEVLKAIGGFFRQQGLEFQDAVTGRTEQQRAWQPFRNAIYYNQLLPKELKVTISSKESYIFHQGYWSSHKPAERSSTGVALIGYIIKRAEAAMREAERFKHKLQPDRNTLIRAVQRSSYKTDKLLRIVSSPDMDPVIDGTAAAFWASHRSDIAKGLPMPKTAPAVQIDMDKLDRIREESLQIQEKLIVVQDSEAALEGLFVAQDSEPEPEGPIGEQESELEAAEPISGEWGSFAAALTGLQKQALAIILSGSQVNEKLQAFAQKNGGILMEVLIETINETAIGHIGDTIIEASDTPVFIYDDYRPDVGRILGREA